MQGSQQAPNGGHHGAIYIGRGCKWAIPFGSASMAIVWPSSPTIPAGCGISITCCARSTNFAARIWTHAPTFLLRCRALRNGYGHVAVSW